jgi:hypothetical protein
MSFFSVINLVKFNVVLVGREADIFISMIKISAPGGEGGKGAPLLPPSLATAP